MALTAACLARLEKPQLDDYNESIQAAVKELQRWTAFQALYDEWPKECVATKPMDTDPLPVDREYRAYVSVFAALLDAERDAEMDQGDLEDLGAA